MNLSIARSIGTDAGNRNMKRGGRTAWSEEDYNVAAAEMERVFPIETELQAQREALEVL